MTWSPLALQGFALAATVADDPGAVLARRGLAPPVAVEWTRVAKELAGLEPEQRRQQVRHIAALVNRTTPLNTGLSGDPALPARALALLASEVDRETGKRWLDASLPPRPGYRPEPGLLSVIRRAVNRSG